MRSSSASRAAAISSASELLPSSSQLDSLLDSLAASSSFSFLLWPLEDKRALRRPGSCPRPRAVIGAHGAASVTQLRPRTCGPPGPDQGRQAPSVPQPARRTPPRTETWGTSPPVLPRSRPGVGDTPGGRDRRAGTGWGNSGRGRGGGRAEQRPPTVTASYQALAAAAREAPAWGALSGLCPWRGSRGSRAWARKSAHTEVTADGDAFIQPRGATSQ